MVTDISCGRNCALMVKSTRIEGESGSEVVIYIPTIALQNHQRVKLAICQNIPQGVGQVFINDDNNQYDLMSRTGNYVRADQLKCRKCYDLVYGSDPTHFSVLDWLKPSCYDEVEATLNNNPPASKNETPTPVAEKTK